MVHGLCHSDLDQYGPGSSLPYFGAGLIEIYLRNKETQQTKT